jgi:hypothetical protein
VGPRAAASFYRIIEVMARIDLYFKVEADVDENEDPRRLAAEIARQIERVFNVRRAELSNMISRSED